MVHALVAQGLAAEETVPGIRGIGRVCRICLAEPLPRAWGRTYPPPPHGVPRRADAPPPLARLRDRAYGPALAPDGEGEGPRVRGARDRARAPARRVSTGARQGTPGATSPLKLPVALDSTRAVFVYAEPGHETATALRSGARRTGGSGTRSQGSAGPSRPWPSDAPTDETRGREASSAVGPRPPAPSESDPAIRDEIARIERAILAGHTRSRSSRSSAVSQAALKRSVALEDEVRRQAERGAMTPRSRPGGRTRPRRSPLPMSRPRLMAALGARKRRGVPMRTSCAPDTECALRRTRLREAYAATRRFCATDAGAASADRGARGRGWERPPSLWRACCGIGDRCVCAPHVPSPRGRSQPSIPPGRDVLR